MIVYISLCTTDPKKVFVLILSSVTETVIIVILASPISIAHTHLKKYQILDTNNNNKHVQNRHHKTHKLNVSGFYFTLVHSYT